MVVQASRRRYRAIFISDIHLGTRGCKAEFLLDFLHQIDAETIYLVGDIVDGWRMKRSWHWPQSHDDVVQNILHKARRGTRVVYVPGNHDEVFRKYIGSHFAGIEVVNDCFHTTADGRRMLVLHGDLFDGIVRYAKWLALMGDWAYDLLLATNQYFNVARRWFGLGYWSLSAYLKNKVKNAVKYVNQFEEALVEEARRHGADGVICGHIHKAEMRMVGDILYVNDGDWVESCTALVEHSDGTLEILEWATFRNFSMLEAHDPAHREPRLEFS